MNQARMVRTSFLALAALWFLAAPQPSLAETNAKSDAADFTADNTLTLKQLTHRARLLKGIKKILITPLIVIDKIEGKVTVNAEDDLKELSKLLTKHLSAAGIEYVFDDPSGLLPNLCIFGVSGPKGKSVNVCVYENAILIREPALTTQTETFGIRSGEKSPYVSLESIMDEQLEKFVDGWHLANGNLPKSN